MPISSQLPSLVATVRGNALQALALQAGQVIEGKVIGPAPGGGTQVQIGEQTLNLLLPVNAKPGTVLQFEVQATAAGQVRLAIQLPPNVPTVQPLPAPQPVVPLPTGLPTPAHPPNAAVVTVPIPAVVAQAPSGSAQVPQLSGGPAVPVLTVGPAPVPVNATLPPTMPGQAVPQTAIANTVLPTTAGPAPIAPPTQPQGVPITGQGGSPVLVAPQTAAPGPIPPAPTPGLLAGLGGPSKPTPVAPPIAAATPQAALAQMVQASVQRQDSAATLMTALTAIVGKVALPEPVLRAAQQVLAGRVSLNAGGLDGAKLQKAVLGSGVFQEANLARGGAVVVGDMKTSLLALRQTLANWLGQQAPIAQAAVVPPPLRGNQPRARLAAPAPTTLPTAPEEAGRVLQDRTEAALSRLRLHQSASLPDSVGRPRADISLDLPVLIGNHQTLLHLQVQRDGHHSAEAVEERGWQMRFAINMPALGEVGAQVSLRGGATGVMLWASEPETAEALQADLADLRVALADAGLKLGAVIVRRGEPAEAAARPGHFVDAHS